MALKRIGEPQLGGGMFPTDHTVFGPVFGPYKVVQSLDGHDRVVSAVIG